MISAQAPIEAQAPTSRRASHGEAPAVLADIYKHDVNIAIWQRELPETLYEAACNFVTANPSFRSSMTVSPDSALSSVTDALGQAASPVLGQNINELVGMFCMLLGRDRAGLRLSVLDGAMCPKFHVDKVPCRLVTTYRGPGTEWLQHGTVDRSKLGLGSRGLADHESGLYQSSTDIQQLGDGDVALLKGELWEGNEDAGLVHRSPAVPAGDARLLVTIDVSH